MTSREESLQAEVYHLREEMHAMRELIKAAQTKALQTTNQMKAIQAQVNELEYQGRCLTDENRRLIEHNSRLSVSLQIKTDQVKRLTEDLESLTVRAGEAMIVAATSQRRAYPN